VGEVPDFQVLQGSAKILSNKELAVHARPPDQRNMIQPAFLKSFYFF
jgi:hypothetical protein